MLSKLFRLRPLIEELEPRILFSADLAPFALDSLALAPEQRVINSEGEFFSVAATTRNELVIVDSGVQDYETLLADIFNQADSDRHFSIVVLDAHRDGIEQITEVLKQTSNLDAVHLISHGGSGLLQLGNSRLDAASLDSWTAEITAWGTAFNANAHLLLYGCDVAAGIDGQDFVQRLALLTQTDVAASDDLTGNAARGGDWDLEYSADDIESGLAFNAVAQTQWQGLLETLANTTTAPTQTQAAVEMNPTSGAYVITWSADSNQDGSNDGVFARVYNAAGTPLSGEIAVNTTTNNAQDSPTVGMAADGSFVIAWQSNDQDGNNFGIYAQRFDTTGTKLGGEILVNQFTHGYQITPSIAVTVDGQFVVAWEDNRNGGDIYVRHFSNAGAGLSNEIRANSNTASGQLTPAVAIDNSGNYVVTWRSDSGASGKAVFAQRFNASDVKLGGAFRVSTYDSSDQIDPAIAMAPDGRFVIAWTSDGQDNGGSLGIYAQRYFANGSADGGEFLVNSTTSGHQDRATVAMDGSGNFVIAWTSDGQDNGGSFGIYAQRYFANGAADGGEFLVNSTTSGNQQEPSAAMSGTGDLVIAWNGYGPRDNKGVFWQQYVTENLPPVAYLNTSITDEDTPISGAAPGVLGNDTDPDVGAVLTVTGILAGTSGTPTTVIAGGVTVTSTYGDLLIRQDGAYTYTPNATTAQALAAGQSVMDVFTYTIKDEKNANASSTLTVTVNGLNDAPVASADSYAVGKFSTLNIAAAGVLNDDVDADTGDTMAVTAVDFDGTPGTVGSNVAGAYGTLILQSDGSLSYEQNTLNAILIGLIPGRSVVDSFTYQVSDGNGGTSNATLNITISGANTAPIANDDAYAVNEDATLAVPAIGVLNNDTDAEGHTLTATLVSGVASGTLIFGSNGSFTYMPNINYFGSDTFSYRVSDGSLASGIATVTLTVTSVNDDAVANFDTGAVNQDATLSVNAAAGVLSNDTDVDVGHTHIVTLIEAGPSTAFVLPGTPGGLTSSYGTLTLYADGSYSYVADGAGSKPLAAGDTSDDSFTYTMQDSAGATSSATLTLTITGSNDAPVLAAIGNRSVNEGATLSFTASATDVDLPADTLTYTLDAASIALGMSINASSGVFSWTPTESQGGLTLSVTVTVTDNGTGTLSDSESFPITVNEANAAPVGTDGVVTVDEDSTYVFTVSDFGFSDPSDSPANSLEAVKITTLSTAGTLLYDGNLVVIGQVVDASDIGLNKLTFMPAVNVNGTGYASLTFQVQDNGGSANGGINLDPNPKTLTINVTPVNDAPTATGSASLAAIAEDSTAPPGATVADLFTANFSNPEDAGSSAHNQFAGVAVRPQSTVSIATQGRWQYSTDSGASWSNFGVLSDTNAVSLGLNDRLRFMPVADYNGTPSALSVRMLDNSVAMVSGGLVDASVNGGTTAISMGLVPLAATVTPVNDAPVITLFDLGSIDEDGSHLITQADLLAGATDIDADNLTAITLTLASGSGTLLNNNDGTWTFTPTADWNGAVSVSFAVEDGTTSVSNTASLVVIPVNDTPVINSIDTPTVAEDKPASVMVKAIDVEGDTLAFSITGGADAALFSLDPATGELKLIAAPNYETPLDANRDHIYEVVVMASDGKGGLASQAIHLVVGHVVEAGAPPPDAPPAIDEPPKSDEVVIQAAALVPDAPVDGMASHPETSNVLEDEAVIQAAALVPDAPVDDMASQRETSNVLEVETGFYAEIHAAVLKPIQVMFHDAARNIDNRETGSFLTSMNQALKSFTSDAHALQLLQNSLDSGSFQQQLNKLQETIRQQLSLDKNTVASTLAVSTGLSVGYVLWLVRGGVLMSSLLASMPAWRLIDPLPILGTLGKRKEGDHDDDSLETLLKKSNAKLSSTPVPKPQVTDGNTP